MNTKRLTLTAFRPGDNDALYMFMSDAEAMRYTYIARSRVHCLARLSAYEARRASQGFAPWVIRRKQDGRVIGWGGLSVDLEEPEWGLEVSYAFGSDVWGQGYATELVKASLDAAFVSLAAPEVHAFARPENQASIRVLDKCGFRYVRYEPSLERNHYVVRNACVA